MTCHNVINKARLTNRVNSPTSLKGHRLEAAMSGLGPDDLFAPEFSLGDKVKVHRRGETFEGTIRGRTFSENVQYDVMVDGRVLANVDAEDLEAVSTPSKVEWL